MVHLVAWHGDGAGVAPLVARHGMALQLLARLFVELLVAVLLVVELLLAVLLVRGSLVLAFRGSCLNTPAVPGWH